MGGEDKTVQWISGGERVCKKRKHREEEMQEARRREWERKWKHCEREESTGRERNGLRSVIEGGWGKAGEGREGSVEPAEGKGRQSLRRGDTR